MSSPVIAVEAWYVGDKYVTQICVARDRVKLELVKYARKNGEKVLRFRKLIERYAEKGIRNLPSESVHNYGDGVLCLGQRHGPMMRAEGFFMEGEVRETFGIFSFFEKNGQRLRGSQREISKELAIIRDQQLWEFVNDVHGNRRT